MLKIIAAAVVALAEVAAPGHLYRANAADIHIITTDNDSLVQPAVDKTAWRIYRDRNSEIEFLYPSNRRVIAGCHYRKIVSLWSAKPPGLTTYIVAFEIFDGALDTGIVAACLIFSFKQRLIQEEAHMPIDVVDVLNHTMPMMPDALSNYTQAIRQSGQLFERAAITTPRRMAHFLGQTLFETGRFTILRENMNYSAQRLFDVFGVNHHSAAVTLEEADNLAHHPEQIAERIYGLGNPHKAQELGNKQPGDGFRYRGNGVLQMTGRSAHRKTGQACGVDFEGNPDLATVPQHALTPALQEWTEGGLNAFADKNDIAEDQWRVQWSSRTQADV